MSPEQARHNAEKQTLVAQRNNALDACALLQGECAVMAGTIAELQTENKKLGESIAATMPQDGATTP